MTRRRVLQYLTVVLGASAFAPVLSACRGVVKVSRLPVPANPTATQTAAGAAQPTAPVASDEPTDVPPTATPAPGSATVALVKTSDRAEGVRRAIALLGALPISGRQVLLKPNFNSADPAPGATHPDVLRAIVSALQERGATSITVGDRSGMGETNEVMGRLGVMDLASELGFETVAFDDLPDDDWVVIDEPGHHWSRGFPVPKLLLDADAVVQTCNLKTHRYGGHFSLSLKNSIGMVAKNHAGYNYMDELHDSSDQRAMIAEANTAYEPALIVVDGVEAFVKGGPEKGTSAATEVVLAGTDRVAVDAVGVAILRQFGTTDDVSGGSVFEQEQIVRAVELGLGVASPELIEIVSDDADGDAYAARVMVELLA